MEFFQSFWSWKTAINWFWLGCNSTSKRYTCISKYILSAVMCKKNWLFCDHFSDNLVSLGLDTTKAHAFREDRERTIGRYLQLSHKMVHLLLLLKTVKLCVCVYVCEFITFSKLSHFKKKQTRRNEEIYPTSSTTPPLSPKVCLYSRCLPSAMLNTVKPCF